jgi:hypothetical protein
MGHSSFKITESVYIDTMAEELAAGHDMIRGLIQAEEAAAKKA